MSFKLFVAVLLIAISTACENVYDKLALSAADLDITVSLVDAADLFDPTCDLEITITSELWQKLLLYFPDGGIPVLSSDKALTFQVGKTYQVSFKISDARRRLQTAGGVTITAVQELDSSGQSTGQYSYVINAYVDTTNPLDWTPMDTDQTAPASLVNLADIGANPKDINISLCTTVDWTKQYVFAVASASDSSKLPDGILVNLELVDCPKTTTSWNVGQLRSTSWFVDLGYYALHSTCLSHGYSKEIGCCTNAYAASSNVEECRCLQACYSFWVTGACPVITTDTDNTTDSCPYLCDPSVIGSCTAATAVIYVCWDDVMECECCGDVQWYTWVQDGACPMDTTPQPDPVTTDDCEDSQWEDWDGPCEEDPGNGCGLYLDFDVNVCILDSWIVHRIFTYSAKEAFVSIVDIDGTDLVCDVDSAYISALLVTYHPGSNVAGSLRRLQNIQTTDIQTADDDDDDKCPVVNDLCGDENNFVPRYKVHVQLSLRCSGDYSDQCDKLSAVALSLQRKDDEGTLNDEYEVSIESASKNNDKSCGVGLGRARLNGYATMTLKNPSGETVLVTTIDISSSSNASERNWFGVVMSVLVVLAFLMSAIGYVGQCIS